jgi:hypothetical protein
MMHEHEKSGPAVVAVRPVNNAERSVAESVEPRAGAEGNASQHSTYRAQYWASVSQALGRIRHTSPSLTQGGSRMRESRLYGSVRGRSAMSVPTAIVARAPRNGDYPGHDLWRITPQKSLFSNASGLSEFHAPRQQDEIVLHVLSDETAVQVIQLRNYVADGSFDAIAEQHGFRSVMNKIVPFAFCWPPLMPAAWRRRFWEIVDNCSEWTFWRTKQLCLKDELLIRAHHFTDQIGNLSYNLKRRSERIGHEEAALLETGTPARSTYNYDGHLFLHTIRAVLPV